MPFIQKDLPHYHYADDDALIGLRGAMYYFQNIHNHTAAYSHEKGVHMCVKRGLGARPSTSNESSRGAGAFIFSPRGSHEALLANQIEP